MENNNDLEIFQINKTLLVSQGFSLEESIMALESCANNFEDALFLLEQLGLHPNKRENKKENELTEKLLNLGFSREKVLLALENSNNNFDNALEILLNEYENYEEKNTGYDIQLINDLYYSKNNKKDFQKIILDQLKNKFPTCFADVMENLKKFNFDIDEKFLNVISNSNSHDILYNIRKEIIKSKFNQGEKKEPNVLFNEIINLNINKSNIKEITKEVKEIFEIFKQKLKNNPSLYSINKPINNLNEEDIKYYCFNFKFQILSKEVIAELIAIISQGLNLFKNIYPRDIQIISIIFSILCKNKGRLLEISTGEGKANIVAMLAVFRTMVGFKVDIATSSSVLANRDAEYYVNFYKIFNLTCTSCHIQAKCQNGKICQDERISKYKEIFKKDIVYGDVSDFEYAIIYEEWFMEDFRSERNSQNKFVIVDEVDSMMIDQSMKIAMISIEKPGLDHLNTIYLIIWKKLMEIEAKILNKNGKYYYFDGLNESIDNGKAYLIKDKREFIKINLTKSIKENLTNSDQKYFPEYLKKIIFDSLSDWIDSAIIGFSMQRDIDYLAEEGVIKPIDYQNTGVVQANTKWSKAVHQFIEIKEKVKITSETLNSTFVSNLSFFLRYKENLNGLTGTLGSISTQNILSEIYNIDCITIPTYMKKQYCQFPTVIINNNKHKYIEEIIKNAIQEANFNRAVLIICKNIKTAFDLKAEMIKNYSSNKIHLYSRNDREDENNIVNLTFGKGHIIISTNLAGRGTDISLEKEVNDNGGLHVILTFISNNSRVEKQAFGRTSRAGAPGTGSLIVFLNIPNIPDGIITDNYIVDLVMENRDKTEISFNKELKDEKLRAIGKKDKLFEDMCVFFKSLIDRKNKDLIHICESIEHKWALFLNKFDNNNLKNNLNDSFNNFKNDIINQLNNENLVENPYFYISRGNREIYNDKKNKYDVSIDFYRKAINIEPDFSSIAYYNIAFCLVSKNSSKQEAIANLDLAKSKIENFLIPEILAIQMFCQEIIDSESGNTPMMTQAMNRMAIYCGQINFINIAIEKIKELWDEDIQAVYTDIRTAFPNSEIQEELNNFIQKGFHFVFNVEKKPKDPNCLTVTALALLSFAQIVGGVVLCYSGIGLNFGLGMINEGIKDAVLAYKVAKGKAEFSWKDYAIQKSLSYSVNLIFPVSKLELIETAYDATTVVMKEIAPEIGNQLEKLQEYYNKYKPIVSACASLGKDVYQIGKDFMKNPQLNKQIFKEALKFGIQKGIEASIDYAKEELDSFLDNKIFDSLSKIIHKEIKCKVSQLIKNNIPKDVLKSLNVIIKVLDFKKNIEELIKKIKIFNENFNQDNLDRFNNCFKKFCNDLVDKQNQTLKKLINIVNSNIQHLKNNLTQFLETSNNRFVEILKSSNIINLLTSITGNISNFIKIFNSLELKNIKDFGLNFIFDEKNLDRILQESETSSKNSELFQLILSNLKLESSLLNSFENELSKIKIPKVIDCCSKIVSLIREGKNQFETSIANIQNIVSTFDSLVSVLTTNIQQISDLEKNFQMDMDSFISAIYSLNEEFSSSIKNNFKSRINETIKEGTDEINSFNIFFISRFNEYQAEVFTIFKFDLISIEIKNLKSLFSLNINDDHQINECIDKLSDKLATRVSRLVIEKIATIPLKKLHNLTNNMIDKTKNTIKNKVNQIIK